MWLWHVLPASVQADRTIIFADTHPRVYSFSDPYLEYKYSDTGLGAAGYISSMDVFFLLDPLTLCFANSKRLRGYTQWVHFSEKCMSLRGFTEHLMASLTKALRLRLFLPDKIRRNKNASEFNHDTLGGLTDQGSRGSPWGYYLNGP